MNGFTAIFMEEQARRRQQMARRWDVVVVGGANMDYLVRGSKLPTPGETIEGDTFKQDPGGKGANQAVAAARLGARVAFIGRMGMDDNGRQIVERLNDEGVDTHYVAFDRQAITGIALVMVAHSAEKQIITAPGANQRLRPVDIRAAQEVLHNTAVVLTQLEIPVECVEQAMRLGYESGAKIVLDPAPARPFSQHLFPMISVIKPNASEATAMTGIEVKDRASARKAAHYLLEQGVNAVAVQAGDEGNLLISAENEVWLPKLAVNSVDTTGAGDAFAAALAVCLAENRSMAETGAWANAAAALKTTGLGAQDALPHRAAVAALVAQVNGATTG
jgi:ribokinase